MVEEILPDVYDYSGLGDQSNMTDYELWEVNLIRELMVILLAAEYVGS